MYFDRADWRTDTPQDPERRVLDGPAMLCAVVCGVILAALVFAAFAL